MHEFVRLGFADIDQILSIEEAVYSHPWTRGNFSDSLMNGHDAFGLRDESSQIIAYFLVMPVVDELHLLNFAVRTQNQKQGYASAMLKYMREYAIEHGYGSILLEVRRSNYRAIEVYLSDGFEEIGRRKGYYPLEGDAREDAIVMRRLC
ncbi:ribosomal protein S18-alanine N-acetyltransferase [Undibacterium jejuense]|uniref:[Ribosomal protein bS18]-alanine N-acetyltransferase n=1 Tax=Undibacterium jejuense TaxID=1344949 RepID=A0A923HA76_9BURK|nr:ribosomal protein S18-alanine N-acetyltransferase [Undibacterium jejuense]MBC3860617.1 ribosomal protein S18-alanine N-acetyltransferase [Undibacterium jejuense]